jgi:hypothetical protein
MPSSKSWFNFVFVNVLFVTYIAGVFYYGQIAEIKAQWPLYRCNPLYMPLAENIQQNFVYCIQSMQTNFMGYLLEPLTFLTSSIAYVMSDFMDAINMVRAMFSKIRGFIVSIIQTVFGVVLNLVIEFQKITISIKDLIGKTIGIMTTLMYIIDGSILTMQSAWNGPPGQMVQAIGKCFYPHTTIKLLNGETKTMNNISLGDILENGAVVEAVMKIDNSKQKIPLYVINKAGVNDENIYVTGSHLVFDKKINKFIKVENYSNATISKVETDWFSCLITSNHNIQIGSQLFWDWEDHYIKLNL